MGNFIDNLSKALRYSGAQPAEPTVVTSHGLPNGDWQDFRDAVSSFVGRPVSDDQLKRLFRIQPGEHVAVGADERTRLKSLHVPAVFDWGPLDYYDDESQNTLPEQHPDDQHVISVQAHDPDGEAGPDNPQHFSHVYLYRGEDGKPKLYLNYIVRRPGSRHANGSVQTMASLDAAKELGVSSVHMNAYTRPPHYRGSAIWPAMGFDDVLPQAAKDRLPPELSGALSVSHLLSMPGGQQFWDAHVAANPELDDDWSSLRNARFDMHPDSLSNHLLKKFKVEYNKKKGRPSPPATGDNDAQAATYAAAGRRGQEGDRRQLPTGVDRRTAGRRTARTAAEEGEAGAVRSGGGFAADFNGLLIRYAAASTADYHRLLEKAPEKGDAASGLYADHLRQNGLHAHADFIERAAAKTGYGVNKFEASGGDHDLPAGQWHATVGSFGGGHSVNLFQKSLHSPNVMFGWSHVGPAEEVAGIVRQLKEEGTEPELVSDASPAAQKKLRETLGLEEAETPDETDSADWWKNSTSLKAIRYELADHQSFQQAIAENVQAHTPQLVYADWLEEQGKPMHAHFIRRAVEGTKDRQAKVMDGDEFGSVFLTTAEARHPNADFATHGMAYESGGKGNYNVDLSSQYIHNGNRIIWHVGGLSGEDARKLRDALAEEGAVAGPISNDDGDPLWRAQSGRYNYAASERPVRYSSVPPHELHDDFQPNGIAPRIGHVLTELSAEDSDLGLLAEGVARTGDTSLLKILADKLDDDGHPHANTVDWRHAERGVKIDKALQHHIDNRSKVVYHNLKISPATVAYDWKNGNRSSLPKRAALAAIRTAVPDAGMTDMIHSILRLWWKERFGSGVHENSPHPPEWLEAMHNEYAQAMGAKVGDAHKYPDTRPANKRYRLAELKAKYGAYKSPAGGMVVKESPHAVAGTFVTGGQFTTDLADIPQTQPKPKVTLSELRRRWKQLCAKGQVKYSADMDTAKNLLNQIAANPEHQTAGSHLRLVAADAMDEQGEHVAAEQLRSGRPIVGYTHANGQNLYVQHESGTHFSLGTPEDVMSALERARRNGTRIHVSLGHTTGEEAGKDWLQETDTTGTVGRSGGRFQYPILYRTALTTQGGWLPTNRIVRIRTAAGEPTGNNVLYQHPKYDHGEIVLERRKKPLEVGGRTYTHTVKRDGQEVANFTDLSKALHYVKKLGLSFKTEPAEGK